MNSQITHILDRISDGHREAIDELVPLVYDQMRQIAAGALRREPNVQADPTELVHDAYIRLIGNEQLAWKSRSHFYAACAVVIRRILVDQARARQRIRRGGDRERLSIELNEVQAPNSGIDLIHLDEALLELERLSPRQSQLVELRFFGGLTEQDASEVLGVSRRTLATDWAMAKVWLQRKLS